MRKVVSGRVLRLVVELKPFKAFKAGYGLGFWQSLERKLCLHNIMVNFRQTFFLFLHLNNFLNGFLFLGVEV